MVSQSRSLQSRLKKYQMKSSAAISMLDLEVSEFYLSSREKPMKKQLVKDRIPLLSAFADGKIIQTNTGEGWRDDDDPDFSDKNLPIRIKPKIELVKSLNQRLEDGVIDSHNYVKEVGKILEDATIPEAGNPAEENQKAAE